MEYQYSETELNELKAKDPVLASSIKDIPHIHKEIWPDPFASLSRQVIAQQISNKALMGILRKSFAKAAKSCGEAIVRPHRGKRSK